MKGLPYRRRDRHHKPRKTDSGRIAVLLAPEENATPHACLPIRAPYNRCVVPGVLSIQPRRDGSDAPTGISCVGRQPSIPSGSGTGSRTVYNPGQDSRVLGVRRTKEQRSVQVLPEFRRQGIRIPALSNHDPVIPCFHPDAV